MKLLTKKLLKIFDKLDKKKEVLEKQYKIDIATLYFSKQYKDYHLSVNVQNDGVYFISFEEKDGTEYTFDLDFRFKLYQINLYDSEQPTNNKYYSSIEEIRDFLNSKEEKKLKGLSVVDLLSTK